MIYRIDGDQLMLAADSFQDLQASPAIFIPLDRELAQAILADPSPWQPDWAKYPEWVRYVVWYPIGFIYLFENSPETNNSYSDGRWYSERIESPAARVFERPTE